MLSPCGLCLKLVSCVDDQAGPWGDGTTGCDLRLDLEITDRGYVQFVTTAIVFTLEEP